MTYSIEALSGDNVHLWNEFNLQSREGTPFHSTQWKNIVEDVLKLKLRYYLIFEDERIIGIFPFVEDSIRHFRGLNGVPSSEFNNVLLDDSFDTSRINDVLSLFSKEHSFLYLYTYNPALLDRIEYDSVPNDDGGNVILNLNQKNPEMIWNDILSKDERYKISRFEKGGFEVREIDQGRDFERFYHYYAENLHHIKGRVLPFPFFQRLLDAFSPNIKIFIVTKEDAFAGGNLAILDPIRKIAYFQYLAINRDLPNKYSPSYYLSWDGINWAWNNGYERISFGRENRDNPRVRNKLKFGAEYVPIHSRAVLLSKTISLLYRLKKTLFENDAKQTSSAGRVSQWQD